MTAPTKNQLSLEEHAALPYSERLFAVEFRDPVGIVYSEPVPEHVAETIRDVLVYSASGQAQPLIRGVLVLPLLADVAPVAINDRLARADAANLFEDTFAGRKVRFVRVPMAELVQLKLERAQRLADELAAAGEDEPPGDDVVFEPVAGQSVSPSVGESVSTDRPAASAGTAADGGLKGPPAASIPAPAAGGSQSVSRSVNEPAELIDRPTAVLGNATNATDGAHGSYWSHWSHSLFALAGQLWEAIVGPPEDRHAH